MRKGYDNHNCHNKPQIGNDVMPGSDGPENLKILKKSQLGVDSGPCRQTVEYSAIELGFRPLRHTVEFFGPLLAEMNRDLNSTRCAES